MGHHLARIDIIGFTDLDIQYKVRILYLNGEFREVLKDLETEFLAYLRRSHRESLVSALALDFKRLVSRVVFEKLPDTDKSILLY